ncbi:MAG: nucleotidyltransferase family protein [Patescibacteria group bacterium]|jgi:hypothetical protein
MIKEKLLLQMLEKNQSIQFILAHAQELNMPDWYLGAGCISQTIWNIKSGFDPENGIKDYDLVYYDATDTSYEAEDKYIQKGKVLFKEIPVLVEIVNEARVYLWYEKHFGKSIEQYKSVEEAISTWPTTATCVGIKKDTAGKIQVYSPFDFDDLFNMVVRPNKPLITKKIYEDKVKGWVKVWPKLKVIPWD